VSLRPADPWDLVGVPLFWLVMCILRLKGLARLNWLHLRPKTSLELEL
jgi:hypothetical protein